MARTKHRVVLEVVSSTTPGPGSGDIVKDGSIMG